MYGKVGIGTSARLRSIASPEFRQLKQTVTLPKAAKLRLAWLDYYRAHDSNAALTCRHFGLSRSCFFKWKRRYDRSGLRGLLDQSKRPKRVRCPLTPRPVIDAVRALRRANPEFSKNKLAVILRRDYGYHVSASTVGRVIARHNLFFAAPVKPKRHPQRRKQLARLRKPKALRVARPGELVEIDVKHLPGVDRTRYGFVTIDVVSKRASVYVSTTASATQGAVAWQRAKRELNLPDTVQVLTDNGAENLGAFAAFLEQQQTTHYFARPRTPKDKPYVERFIGTLERECIQWGGVAPDTADQQQLIDAWLTKYPTYRPHQALGYLTPDEYLATLHTLRSVHDVLDHYICLLFCPRAGTLELIQT